jgi:60 kDa SS-A/Ro ribonucleoprotein
VLLREICEKVSVYTFSEDLVAVPARHGFALRDAISASQKHNGTRLGHALSALREPYDRIVVITDEQSHDAVPGSRGDGYMINVASYKNGVGYGKWTHIDGWSEAVVDYIRSFEQTETN